MMSGPIDDAGHARRLRPTADPRARGRTGRRSDPAASGALEWNINARNHLYRHT
jgi:hypothetical protein